MHLLKIGIFQKFLFIYSLLTFIYSTFWAAFAREEDHLGGQF